MSQSKDVNLGRTLFDDYKVQSVVGKNNLATVYQAKMISQEKLVALKTLNFLKRDILEQFEEAVKKQEKLDHPNIVKTIACEKTSTGRVFQVMDYVAGVTVKELVESSGALDNEDEIVDIIKQISTALGYAHIKNVIHGCLSPDNVILMEESGNVVAKVGDFATGNVKTYIGLDADIEISYDFISPEVNNLKDATQASDIYSLGLILYYLAAARLPFNKENPSEFFHLRGMQTQIEFPEMLDTLIDKALQTDPFARHESIDQFMEELQAWYEKASIVRAERQEEKRKQLELQKDTLEDSEVIALQEEELVSQLKQSVHDIVTLKEKQFNQEETVAMKFTDIAAVGARQSPEKTVKRIVISSVASVAILAALAYSFIKFQEPIRESFKKSSQNMSAMFYKQPEIPKIDNQNELDAKKRLKPTKAAASSPLIKESNKVKTNQPPQISHSSNVSPELIKQYRNYYFEELPKEKLLIKQPYHPPPNKKYSGFTNNMR